MRTLTKRIDMAKLAPVVPTHIAEALQGEVGKNYGDALGGYHLLLAHDILAKPAEYQRIYNKVRQDHHDSFIILDNSIIELGKPLPIKDLLEASKILRPDCIVIPDVMGKGDETRESAVQFTREYAQRIFELDDDNPVGLMGVLQGDTIGDVMSTMAVFYALPLIEYVGIPRVLTKMLGSRMPVLCAMQRSPACVASKYRSFAGYHLLGFSDNIIDDVACARVPWIQGIDSNVPVRAGAKGVTMSIDDVSCNGRIGPRGDFWNSKMDDTALDLARSNLSTYRRWIASE